MMTAAIFLGVRVLMSLNGSPKSLARADLNDLLGVVAVILFCVVYRVIYAVHVGPDGISTLDGFGRRHDVRWDAMRRTGSFLGFLHVPHREAGTAIWIPLFLDDAVEFREYVIAHAPEGNPLRTYLAAR